MALPPGIVTTTVTFGVPVTWAGDEVKTTLTVTPTHSLTWAATGTPIPAFKATYTVSGVPGSFQVPVVDQPGFVDSTGAAFTMWAYTVTGLWEANGQEIPFKKTFQPLTGQGTIDLDLLPEGAISLPLSAPVAPVTSVNGQTGAVTIEAGGVLDSSVVRSVIVETGDEARPNADLVIWHSATEPANMGPTDWWVQPDTGGAVETPPTPAVGATYSVFGDAAYPYALQLNNETPIRVANAFYTYGAGVTGWRCVGARIYIPAGLSLPSSAVFGLHPGTSTAKIDLSLDPARSAVLQNITTGWNEVLFATPYEMTPGAYHWISYDFGNGQYLSAADPSNGGFVASTEAPGLVEADGEQIGGNLPTRGAYRYASGAADQNMSHFGVDILIDKGAP